MTFWQFLSVSLFCVCQLGLSPPWETTMSDETVRVPAALVEALREATDVDWGNVAWMSGQANDLIHAAAAILDAAERPDEVPKRVCGDVGYGWSGEEIIEADAPRRPCVSEHGDAAKCRKCYPAPAAPVGDPLCKCGHAKDQWHPYGQCAWPCPCPAFTPAPLSSPRRTRDEGTEDEAYEAFVNWYGADVGGPTSYEMKQTFVAGYRQSLIDAADAIQALHPGEVKNSVIWLRARAARLAGEDDRG